MQDREVGWRRYEDGGLEIVSPLQVEWSNGLIGDYQDLVSRDVLLQQASLVKDAGRDVDGVASVNGSTLFYKYRYEVGACGTREVFRQS